MFPHPIRSGAAGLAFAASLTAAPASAGITNPDLSAIGQVRADYTQDPAAFDTGEPTLGLGECEFILDAALNPYLRGTFVLAADEEAIGLEEAYAALVRGLPFGLGLKAGRYRLGFGRLNVVHPHAYPFLDAPPAWASLLPGEDGFADVALQASILLHTPGEGASTVSADLLRGAAFHPGEDETRFGVLGRWSHGILLGERGALEAGLSGATGLDSVGSESRAYLAGLDMKVKVYLPGNSSLVLQAEGLYRHGRVPGGSEEEDRNGFYAFADYNHRARWNGGFVYDQAVRAGDPGNWDRNAAAFGGFAVLEESTLLRLAVGYSMPEGDDWFYRAALQLLFSMGPHKPHRF